MFVYVLRRLVGMIPILVGVTLITFALFHFVGGNPAYQFAGKNASAEEIATLERELGMDRPLIEQYFTYVGQISRLDFGRSWASKQDITTMLGDGIGASLSLAIPSFFIGTILAISIALMVGYFRGKLIDKLTLTFCLAMMSVSVIVYILGLQYLLAYQWGWFPISGWDPDILGRWKFIVLPSLIWILVSQGSWILLYRTIFLDEQFQDYVRTARAKGLSAPKVYFKHILKNAMIPIITIVMLQMPYLMTGSLLLENFFGIPGLGNLMIQALLNSDFPVVKAMTFIGTVLYMVFNLASDVLYAVADPRVRLS